MKKENKKESMQSKTIQGSFTENTPLTIFKGLLVQFNDLICFPDIPAHPASSPFSW